MSPPPLSTTDLWRSMQLPLSNSATGTLQQANSWAHVPLSNIRDRQGGGPAQSTLKAPVNVAIADGCDDRMLKVPSTCPTTERVSVTSPLSAASGCSGWSSQFAVNVRSATRGNPKTTGYVPARGGTASAK